MKSLLCIWFILLSVVSYSQWDEFHTIVNNSDRHQFAKGFHWNNDGALDLFCEQGDDSDNYLIFENNGFGHFQPVDTISLDVWQHYRFESADFNQDGLDDLIWIQRDNPWEYSLVYMLNLGNGEFSPSVVLNTVEGNTDEFFINDFDTDNFSDVLLKYYEDGYYKIKLFKSNGDGSFQNGEIVLNYSGSSSSETFKDVNGDNLSDFSFYNSQYKTFHVYENIDATSLLAVDTIYNPNELFPVQYNKSYYWLNSNGDDDYDLLFAANDGSFFVFENSGGIEFNDPVQLNFVENENYYNINIFDYNTDGFDDVFLDLYELPTLRLMENTGSAEFQISDILLSDVDLSISNLYDFDLDDDLDFLMTSTYGYHMLWLENQQRGCTDPSACNYDPLAIEDTGNCCFSDCGCTNVYANNYDPNASCDSGDCDFECFVQISDVSVSLEYCDYCGNSTIHAFIDGGNSTGNLVWKRVELTSGEELLYMDGSFFYSMDGNYILVAENSEGCSDTSEVISINNYEPLSVEISNFRYDQNDTHFNIEAYHQSSDSLTLTNNFQYPSLIFPTNTSTTVENGNSLYGPNQIYDSEGCVASAELYIGDSGYLEGTPYSYWESNNIYYDWDNYYGYTLNLEYLGCTSPDACNFDPLALIWDGSCVYPGCMDSTACNYSPLAGCDDGTCGYAEGCTSPLAYNFDPYASCEDGSCEYFTQCWDENACNYGLQYWYCSDYACSFGICGCTNELALNFDPQADSEDGSCVFDCTLEITEVRPTHVKCGCNSWGSGAVSFSYIGGAGYVIWKVYDLNGNLIAGMPEWLEEEYVSYSHPSSDFGSMYSLPAGSYILQGTDMLGCSVESEIFTILDQDPIVVTTLDIIPPNIESDSTVVYFTITGGSGDYTFLEHTYYESPTLESFSFGGNPVYRSARPGNFNYELVFHDGFGCITPAYFEVQNASTDVLCEIQGCLDETACNYMPYALCDDGTCKYISGCTNPDSDNYNPLAECDDGSCSVVTGCGNPYAVNYNPNAICFDNSCLIDLNGIVFDDLNGDGELSEGEYGIPFVEVIITPGEYVAITNDLGQFLFPNLPPGYYELEVLTSEAYPYVTTEYQVNVSTYSWEEVNVNFGLTIDQPVADMNVYFYSMLEGYPCDLPVNHDICFRNMGNNPISGVIELVYDDLFQGYSEMTAIDSVVGNHVYFSYSNLLPGQMFHYNIDLQTPAVDQIGEQLWSTVNAYMFMEDTLLWLAMDHLILEMTCAYDPNDKQAFPLAYSDEHFVLNGTEEEYLVRFQNTGNASATTVLIRDTLDVNLDISTFQLVANSHSVMVNLDPIERVVEFLFANIMLPDSNANEPGSHGFVSYRIDPLPDLEPWTEINNTAYIYFDNNPPIVTNTTWYTIFDCNWLSGLPEYDNTCVGTYTGLPLSQNYVESYEWTLDGELMSENESQIMLNFTDEGEHILGLVISNPLCADTSEMSIFVHPLPATEITVSGSLLTAPEGVSWTWFLNGNIIPGANDQSLMASDPGTYSVEIVSEWSCTSLSEEVVIVGLEELNQDGLSVFPNPSLDNVTIRFSNVCNNCYLRLVDSGGKLIREWNSFTGNNFELDVTKLSQGRYTMVISGSTNWEIPIYVVK